MTAFDFAKLVDMGALKAGLLYPYQSDGVAFLLSKKRAVLGDDMGLGKTRQAIVSMQMGAPEGKVLVVCPAALKLNWRRKFFWSTRMPLADSRPGTVDRPERDDRGRGL